MLAVITNGFAPAGNRPLDIHEYDFKKIFQMDPRPWISATADESGLAAEFAFDGTAPAAERFLGSVDCADGTTLCQVSKDRQTELGHGLLLRMTLPVSFTPDQAIAKAHEINLAETHEHTVAYFIGAWCSVSLQAVAPPELTARLVARHMGIPETVETSTELVEDTSLRHIGFCTFLPALVLRNPEVVGPFLWSMAARSRWVKQHLAWH